MQEPKSCMHVHLWRYKVTTIFARVQELGQKNDDLGRKIQTCNAMFANGGVCGQQMPTTSHNFNGFVF